MSDDSPTSAEPVAQVHVDENGYITEDPWTDSDIDNLILALECDPGDEQWAADAVTVIKQLRAHPPTSAEPAPSDVEALIRRLEARWADGDAKLEQEAADMLRLLSKDAERLDFVERKRATIYSSEGARYWVFVDETVPARQGQLGDSLRACIDAALAAKEQK